MSKKSLSAFNIYIVLGLIFIALIGLRTISTPEIWTHLAQGQNNAPISFLDSDTMVNTTHLYDKLMYTAWNIGGAPLLIILNIIGLLAAFSLLVQVSKKWGGGISQGFALLISGHLIFQTLDVGPQVIMMLFCASFLYVLSIAKNPALLFGALIPLQILWVNMHGSFLFGPVIAGLTAIQVAQSSKGPTSRAKKNATPSVGTYGILAIALLASTVINPYFFKIHEQVIANINNSAPAYWSSLFIDYFQIPALKPLIVFILVLGAAGLITLKKKLPFALTSLAMIGAFLGWASPQSSMIFAVLAFPFLVLSLTATSEYVHGSLATMLGEKKKLLPAITGGILAILLIGSMIPVITNGSFIKTGSASNFGFGIQENLFPNDCEAILNHPDFPVTAINLAADGGYLAFKYNRKCFIDYRPGRYSKELLTQTNKMLMLGDKKAYDEIIETYRPEAFIINTLSPVAASGIHTLITKHDWKLAYFDGTTAILLPNNEKFAQILNDSNMQKAGLEKLEKARAEYAENGGGNPAELIGSGKIYLAFNRPTEAKAIFSLILQGNDRCPGAWIGLGNSQLLLKEFGAAITSLEMATHQAPQSVQAWRTLAAAYNFEKQIEKRDHAIEMIKKLNASALEKQKKEPEEEEKTPLEPIKPKTSILDMAIPE